jgi:hypothetical protein
MSICVILSSHFAGVDGSKELFDEKKKKIQKQMFKAEFPS